VRALPYTLALAIVFRGSAQEPTFSTDVKVVTILATVRDNENRTVKNLTKDDFVLEEDGRPQIIQYFSQESDLPLTIGLLVDTSRSQIHVLEPERKASYTFLDKILREDKDLAFVLHFDIKVNLLQGLTSSREQLERALSELRIPRRPSTLLYDAIKEASEGLMRKQTGRKAFIVLSDGVDVRSEATMGTAIEYAQRADTLIYSIVFAHHSYVAHPAVVASQELYLLRGRKAMQRLARETGGGYFVVSKSEPIEKIYGRIEDELRHQYSIGYTSDRRDASADYRKIHLSAKRPGLAVQSREGYYPVVRSNEVPSK
jgi:VWFA-related protein